MGQLRDVKIPLSGDAYANVDDAVLNEKSAQLVNAYTDEAGATNKRPGLTGFVDLGTAKPVEGLYWWEFDQSVIAVSDGRIWRITDPTGTKAEISLTGALLENYTVTAGKRRVEFAETGTKIFMANGKFVYYPNGSSVTELVSTADADAPTNVLFVTAHDGYILCDDHSVVGKFMWSNPGAPLSWSALNYATLESKPDDLMQVKSAWREVFLPGSDSIEVWYNDGTTPFSRLEGAYTEDGMIAYYSLALVQGQGAWVYFNKNRDVVMLAGRTPKVLSLPFGKYLDTLANVSDAWGETLSVNGRRFYVLTLIAANKTLVHDLVSGGWAEWGSWNGSTYDAFIGRSYAYAVGWNLNLWGCTDGVIRKMDPTSYKDVAAIRSVRRTGNIDHDTGYRKKCLRLRLRVKRGVSNADVASPVIKVRWRDNHSATWNNWLSLSLGTASTDEEFYVDTWQLGEYRSRQWEFVQDQACGFVLAGAEEMIEVLGR